MYASRDRSHTVEPKARHENDLLKLVARAIGEAQDELWPVRRREPRLRPEEMYAQASAAALTEVRRAIEGLDRPESVTDATGWEAHRLAVAKLLAGG